MIWPANVMRSTMADWASPGYPDWLAVEVTLLSG
jgi:hypothetical protein